ncbi:NAD(P)/FAD-dependent oxidoreductase [Streptomyces sp. NBC_00019]|uniref:NAD(P)/FAD-dependent oxidoreductase n=1 Tax=Streptomyces sp. NBC_00019 TaxID=2975623 RepID=UPI00324DDA47
MAEATPHTRESVHGVVLGGGLAGVLAARALRDHVDKVTVIERDTYPDRPEPRKGAPQSHHAHILWSGGAEAIEALLPGTLDRLRTAGTHRIGVKQDMVLYSAYGWQHRFPSSHYALTCSRPLLDRTVRDAALGDPRIEVLQGAQAQGLLGDHERVTGARVRTQDGTTRDLPADLVVDATGRGSRLKHWLGELGLPPVTEESVDTGLTYATRVFRAPDGAPRPFPVVSVYADHRTGRPGRNGLLLPIEDGRWIITLSGTRGGEPTTDENHFATFARTLRDPLIADLIDAATPLTPVRTTRSTLNRRLHLDRLTRHPEGLVALGDCVVSLNPIHGHGMSVAARSAHALENCLRRAGGLKPGLARTAQRAIAAAADAPWLLSASQDLCYPDNRADVSDPRLTTQAARRQGFADLVTSASLVNERVCDALTAVTTLTAPLAHLETPEFLTALRQGPARPPLSAAPLSVAEAAVLRRTSTR